MSFLSRMATRVGSAAVLAGLVAGIPWGLVTLTGWPLPTSLTLPRSVEDLQDLLATPLTDQTIVNLLAVAMWLIWASFTASLASEAVAALRGVPARRLPVLSPLQKLAGWLLSGLTAGVLAAATLTPTMALPATPAVATVVAPPQADPAAISQPPVVCAGEHILVIDGRRYAYVVQKDDSLWHIADLCLDDPHRWTEIWDLNKHRHFPGVGGSLHDPDLIYPGWDLHLPDDAAPPASARPIDPAEPAAPAQPAESADPVEPSGSPSQPPEVAPATPRPPAAPEAATPPPGETIDQTVPEPPAVPEQPAAPEAQPPTGDEADEPSQAASVLPVTAVLATAGLLTALVLARLRHHRGRRQQHRRHGHRLAEPDPTTETTVRIAAQPADVARLDHALRALAAALHDLEPTRLPDIVAAWLDTGTVHLLLAAPSPDPPPPWAAAADDMTWTLPADAELPDAIGQLAPLPTLVTLASHPAGQHLLVDLERAGLLTITGDPARRSDLLRYLAAELATADWVDDAEVVLAGFDPDETAQLIALNEERVRAATSLADALQRVTRRASANTAALADSGADDTLAGRIGDIAADAWMPHLLIIADPTADLTQLDHDLHPLPRCAVAVIAAADHPGTWNIHINPEGLATIDWLSITGTHAASLPADQLARLAPMLRTARTLLPTDQAGFDEPVPPAEDEPWAESTDTHGHLLDHDALSPADPMHGDDLVHGDAPRPDDPAERSMAVDPTPAHADDTTSVSGEPADQAHQPYATGIGPISTTVPGSAPRRVPADPDLDNDLADWHTPVAEHRRPRIAILGPVTVDATGQPPAERQRFYREVIVYLASRGTRGAAADQLDEAIWPERGITYSSRRVAMSKVRSWLGENHDGELWLPPNLGGDRIYRINDGYLFDWHLFRRLRARGESLGEAGTTDLRRALELVRGTPLDHADRPYATGTRNPYSWLPTSGIPPHHLISAIVDTAHQLATLSLDTGDTTTARWAVEQAWLADPDRLDDHPWIDLMRIHHAHGHTSQLRTLIEQLIETRGVEVPEDLTPRTFQVINELASDLLHVVQTTAVA